MALFYFNIYWNGDWMNDAIGEDYPDCGMAFRAARTIIDKTRSQEDLSENALAEMVLQVTYEDSSELFSLPFNLGI